jgi:NitT/TauT family transport system substrate-binding protein
MAQRRLWLSRREGEALRLQFRAVHRRQEVDPAGVAHLIETQGGFRPNVFLLADVGYDGYSTTIETRADTIEKKPDLVQRFVDASIIGWQNYLNGDNASANAAIKRDNPEMTDGQIAFSLQKMKERGVVDSGDAQTLGVGAMTHARMKSFFEKMAKAGVVPADLDYKKGYTLRFIGKKVGMEAKR